MLCRSTDRVREPLASDARRRGRKQAPTEDRCWGRRRAGWAAARALVPATARMRHAQCSYRRSAMHNIRSARTAARRGILHRRPGDPSSCRYLRRARRPRGSKSSSRSPCTPGRRNTSQRHRRVVDPDQHFRAIGSEQVNGLREDRYFCLGAFSSSPAAASLPSSLARTPSSRVRAALRTSSCNAVSASSSSWLVA